MKPKHFVHRIGAALLCMVATLAAAEKPNVVIIYDDDVGFNDVSVNGTK